MTQPTGYCQFEKCKAPLYNGLKYCNVLCGQRASAAMWRARQKDKPAACTHEIPSYRVCVRCENAKRRAVFKANKKHHPGAKLGIPHASFPKG